VLSSAVLLCTGIKAITLTPDAGSSGSGSFLVNPGILKEQADRHKQKMINTTSRFLWDIIDPPIIAVYKLQRFPDLPPVSPAQ
ncbi:MAG: hypothetical protein CVU51_16845, partial [Deltaproteobacteria bacterium HGW-Deltaproteobacteria-1]